MFVVVKKSYMTEENGFKFIEKGEGEIETSESEEEDNTDKQSSKRKEEQGKEKGEEQEAEDWKSQKERDANWELMKEKAEEAVKSCRELSERRRENISVSGGEKTERNPIEAEEEKDGDNAEEERRLG